MVVVHISSLKDTEDLAGKMVRGRLEGLALGGKNWSDSSVLHWSWKPREYG